MGGWLLTVPAIEVKRVAAGHPPNAANGEEVFTAAGCASCHAAPGAKGAEKQILSGGHAFETAFGTFYAPNISPGRFGIAGWTLPQFANAVTQGVSPEGEHYYPAFPYTSYTHMTEADVSDLFAYMQRLPISDEPSQAHDVSFPFNIRRSLGFWKRLNMPEGYVLEGDLDPELDRGRYLVEGLAHCGECHTPRNRIGGLNREAWLTGAPNPSGKGRIPDITSGGLEWSHSDLTYYFASGLTPDYDSVGGEMAAVVDNLSQLPQGDREAIAAYLLKSP